MPFVRRLKKHACAVNIYLKFVCIAKLQQPGGKEATRLFAHSDKDMAAVVGPVKKLYLYLQIINFIFSSPYPIVKPYYPILKFPTAQTLN